MSLAPLGKDKFGAAVQVDNNGRCGRGGRSCLFCPQSISSIPSISSTVLLEKIVSGTLGSTLGRHQSLMQIALTLDVTLSASQAANTKAPS